MSELKAPESSAPAEPSLGLEASAGAAKGATPYRVLARKYRPARFEDLIGQEPMVRTLANSFAAGRIHQAYILTGVRGVGKTTTARILARAFNYCVPGKIDRPSIDMPELGVHCQAIMESRHVDVIEMDAASHTGIDDVREIIENARYRPVSARTKVYIVDEVHMLSKQAFNGLLKTLEEPPEHVKFLFATTEIEKVPITVRSRCIRFDLKRIETGAMVRHLEKICAAEGVVAEARRAGADRARRRRLGARRAVAARPGHRPRRGGTRRGRATCARCSGSPTEARSSTSSCTRWRARSRRRSSLMARLHLNGADPAELLIELAEFCHFVTRAKLAPSGVDDAAISENERERGAELAQRLALGPLTRAWQILIKGVEDVKDSPRPLASAEMALIRLAFAADLPTPEDALRKLAESGEARAATRARRSGAGRPSPSGGASALRAAAPPAPAPARARR